MTERKGILQVIRDSLWNPNYKNFSIEDPQHEIDGFTIAQILGGSGKSAAGIDVNEEAALTFSAVWACVQSFAGPFSYFPVHLYNVESPTKRTRILDDPYLNVINQPLPYMTRNVMMERAMFHVKLWGNAYIEPLWTARRRSLNGLFLHHPSTVKVKSSGSGISQKIVYEIHPTNNNKKEDIRVLRPDQIIHVPGLGDQITGKSVIKYAREDIGLELAAREYGSKFFSSGGKPTGVLNILSRLTPEQKKQLKEEHHASKMGGGDLILGGEAKYQPISIPPEDAQFLETRHFDVTTIARWFGVPPWKIADLREGSTFRNIEEMGIAFLKDSMAPIVEKFEAEFNSKLYGAESSLKLEFDMEAYLRADAQASSEMNRTGIQNAYKTPNEVRAKNGDNPIEGGDKLFLQSNMIPLDMIEKLYNKDGQK